MKSSVERIVELASAQWLGKWEGHVMFRDPVTGSSCCLPERGLTVSSVLAKLKAKRKEFGKEAAVASSEQ